MSQHLLYSTFVALAKNSLPPIQSSKYERKFINNTLFASQYPATPQLEQNYLHTSERRISCLPFIGVLFSVGMLISNRTWVSSFIISSKQTTVFFWQSIGAASVDRRIWKVTERARNSQAEPGGKKSLWGVKSFQLYKWSYKKNAELQNEKSNRQTI